MIQYNYSVNEHRQVSSMNDNLFFKPTPLYKEFMILDLIEKNSHITQRVMSKELGVAVSMINAYLDEYELKGYINRKYRSTKSVDYNITKKGRERIKVLNISYLNSSQDVYRSAKENIFKFLDQIINKGFKNILLYGAGEVAEILLQAINEDKDIPINILAVIDDDEEKQNHYLINSEIISKLDINNINHDGILISSYTNNTIIYNGLLDMNYDKTKIIQFFEL